MQKKENTSLRLKPTSKQIYTTVYRKYESRERNLHDYPQFKTVVWNKNDSWGELKAS